MPAAVVGDSAFLVPCSSGRHRGSLGRRCFPECSWKNSSLASNTTSLPWLLGSGFVSHLIQPQVPQHHPQQTCCHDRHVWEVSLCAFQRGGKKGWAVIRHRCWKSKWEPGETKWGKPVFGFSAWQRFQTQVKFCLHGKKFFPWGPGAIPNNRIIF